MAYKIKGKSASPSQTRALNEIFRTATQLGGSRRFCIACNMCVTQESVCQPLSHGDGPGPDSRGYYQQRDPWGPTADRMDPGKSTTFFANGGKGGQKGWKQNFGSLKKADGDLGSMITKVQGSVGGYSQWESESTKNYDLWAKGDGKDVESGSGGEGTETVVKDYLFKLGRRENAWQKITDLATEVGFKAYMAGDTFTYASEIYLRNQRPVATLAPGDPSIVGPFTFDWDNGLTVKDLSVTVLADRYALVPGSCVAVKGLGPANGLWLVATTSRSLFDNQMTLGLKIATSPLLEPPAETEEKSSGGEESSDGKVDGDSVAAKVYNAALEISEKTPGYLYGGGHGPALSKLKPSQKLDCSSSTSLALYMAGAFKGSTAIVSGAFNTWGKPGPGKNLTVWFNSEHVFIHFNGLGKYKRFDTGGPNGGNGPKVHTDHRSTSGFKARHLPGDD